eukprot:CAMPEP_0197433214 /NCGR_PEP_ID=MMETSP1175-20131217/1147_1 /TAXON_ID=1003142 /ORGANISM="Triceratium dubium, Strain CCMP147" /LENGTH=378 /DNA_ID=CAMNT_0042961525 /DNA_START=49 /DNA_END=1185 /DNA_ORIENTATION=+
MVSDGGVVSPKAQSDRMARPDARARKPSIHRSLVVQYGSVRTLIQKGSLASKKQAFLDNAARSRSSGVSSSTTVGSLSPMPSPVQEDATHVMGWGENNEERWWNKTSDSFEAAPQTSDNVWTKAEENKWDGAEVINQEEEESDGENYTSNSASASNESDVDIIHAVSAAAEEFQSTVIKKESSNAEDELDRDGAKEDDLSMLEEEVVEEFRSTVIKEDLGNAEDELHHDDAKDDDLSMLEEEVVQQKGVHPKVNRSAGLTMASAIEEEKDGAEPKGDDVARMKLSESGTLILPPGKIGIIFKGIPPRVAEIHPGSVAARSDEFVRLGQTVTYLHIPGKVKRFRMTTLELAEFLNSNADMEGREIRLEEEPEEDAAGKV